MSTRADRTFAALHVRNYRLYFAGQAVNLVGTWMQSVALSWLAFELTHSGTVIGLVLAMQFLPVVHGGDELCDAADVPSCQARSSRPRACPHGCRW